MTGFPRQQRVSSRMAPSALARRADPGTKYPGIADSCRRSLNSYAWRQAAADSPIFSVHVRSTVPMPDLKLKTVTRAQGNNAALKDGSVTPKTFSFAFEEVDPLIAAFRRMVRANEFDICEMAITTYICARAHGKPFTALPIFLVRAFHHGATLHNTRAGLRSEE